jgi:GNAT superfamily N-acetyltransferase
MGALTLAPLVVLGFDEVDTGASPLLGEHICVVHVHVDGSAADPLRIDAWSGEMDGQLVAMGERIPLVVVRGAEAQLLVVSNRTRYIRDHENRLDTDDALHGKIIGVADLQLCPPPLRGHSRTPAHAKRHSPSGYGGDVTADPIEIRAFEYEDLEAVVEFSLRAWEPVFTSVRGVLGDEVFLRLHPEWQESQAEAVRSSCTNPDRDVFVAVVDDRPVAFVAVALNAFHERMGWIDIIGVDPDYQRRGISSQLTELAIDHMRSHGMDIAVVETGGDPGHAPARAAYEAAGFTLLPVARYFRLLD